MDSFAQHPYASFLHLVEKPARYTGGEVGQRRKDWAAVRARICLAFPDVYDIGMSHLGYKILYKILNDDERTLAERCYCPWIDMEAQLRQRGLPLVSLESARPLRDFDVVGLSLQYELTFTNCLTILDLGGIPLRSSERGEEDPLVLAGGPVATHPEAVAPFFDAIVIGDGEEKLKEVALAWVEMKEKGIPRAERLRSLAKLGGVYVPSLYEVALDQDTGLCCVVKPEDPELPFPVRRTIVEDLNRYPFPDDSPIGGPEAIFDRMSIEIARGCTEGCRFCQAGMIYRPVRERDPEQIVDTVVRAVKKSGYDEVSLTALSTADYSCISPLVKKVVERLAPENVSLGISSLRAYGLGDEVMDALVEARASGLTFAPEAGTQRMRDVINKNVTEEQLLETAKRVFSRGFEKMKLYFILGLPTETDDDIRGIVETGARTLAIGKQYLKHRAGVTISVSSHVPKPHTPFQWCAMDTPEEIERKQRLLQEEARKHKLDLRKHDVRTSVLEGIMARGDRRIADVIERAWRNGARFDSWEDKLRLDVWQEAFEHFGIDTAAMLRTLPVGARLPWDHIDVGLEPSFLVKEYRKALKNRLSPPCGKTFGRFVHYTNLEEHRADKRPLVCYHCGVACDLDQMRREREVFLAKMGAEKRLPVVSDAPKRMSVEVSPKGQRRPPERPTPETPVVRYRFRFDKVGPVALLGHLDLLRAIPRIFRRLGIAMAYSQGFRPKPDMTFSPALSLGVLSLGEYLDVGLHADLALDGLLDAMNESAPSGLRFTAVERLREGDPSISKIIEGARYLFVFARDAIEELGGEAWLAERIAAASSAKELRIRRELKGLAKYVDVREYLREVSIGGEQVRALVERAGFVGDLVIVDATVAITGQGAAKPKEIIEAITQDESLDYRAIRAELFGADGIDPMDLPRVRARYLKGSSRREAVAPAP